MKNKKVKIAIIIIAIILLVGVIFFMMTPEENISQNRKIENTGDDTYTLMIYMCASDLESDGGYATNDIEEMLSATVDSKVNVILETGGTSKWQKFGISNTTNQIYKIEDGELKLVKDDLGLKSMTESSNLTDFIEYCKNNYQANKYGLILWDHGGGAVSGYGYDENNENKDDTLTIDELQDSLKNSNAQFDFIGFDACLMANAETAYSVKDYSKYLIASEETEPGTGWEYTSLLNKISSDTSEDAKEVAKTVADNFIQSNENGEDQATLSTIDLSKINNVFKNLYEFFDTIKSQNLDNNNFAYISKAVENTKSYGDGECDTIDLINFAQNVNNDKSEKLVSSIKEAVIYNKTTDNITNSNGLSLYFPYSDLEYYQKMLEIYPKIGISDNYTNELTTFVNILVGGKNDTYTINSHTYNTNENYSQYGWYNQSVIDSNSNYYEQTEYSQLQIEDKGDYYALNISDNDWNIISKINQEVMYDDGNGYLDLGTDNYYELDNENNLKITFDNTWISINGNTVPFYVLEEKENYTKGKVPAYLNGTLVDLIIVWNEENPNGKVLGAQEVNEYGDTTISSKGLKEIKNGDKIEFVFDYYTYEGEYKDSYTIGDPFVVENNNLTVSYEDVGEGKYYVYYKITDIYGNEYYTEAVTFE